MIKQFIHPETFLIESPQAASSSSSDGINPQNQIQNQPVVNFNSNEINNLNFRKSSPNSLRVSSFTYSRAISQDHGTGSNKFPTVNAGNNGNGSNNNLTSSKRSNFLKVCSWPFTRSDTILEKNDESVINESDYHQPNNSESNEQNLKAPQFVSHQNHQKPLAGNPTLVNKNDQSHYNEKFSKVLFTRRKHQQHLQQQAQQHTFNENIRRCIIVSNLDQSMGVNSVIQQVCGGPLEKVIKLPNNQLELYFIFPQQAKQFYQYGKSTGLLIVNGIKLKVEWSDQEFYSNNGYINQNMNEDIENYNGVPNNNSNVMIAGINKSSITQPFSNIVSPPMNYTLPKFLYNEIISNGCRRCLIISKIIVGKKIRQGDKMFYPEPEIHYSKNLQIQDIKNDFQPFGEIMDIGSVISRKLSFSVFYFDIRSAILAKTEFEKNGSELSDKYKDWSIWYGKDITDRACFVL
ncbi:uncharacterized protein KGF55_001577 [Candida pseudojiufengensis]|uniref:uncharacterized protein n=1 Tax=Candida pseudojiufengensis TaxID=497109 RepID=UPI0022255B5E|nr:uncharacterized protein KGF55_001577 [Candida pseudojiufengensis]KAI5965356.1 hypothetical protein KGF55_001577 [Candida pseudojiufengensis]